MEIKNPAVFAVVKKAVDKADLYGLLKDGCASDEFDGESNWIADAIVAQSIKTPEVLADYICRLMNRQFGLSEKPSDWADTAKEIIAGLASSGLL